MTARDRAQRLIKLYTVRENITDEIRALEATMAAEQEAVARARKLSGKREQKALCGTDSGYFRHRRRLSEAACPSCLIAHRVAERERARKRRNLSTSPVVDSDSRPEVWENGDGPEGAQTPESPGLTVRRSLETTGG